MSHTYAQNIVHLVFSTKDRRKTVSADFQPKVWAYSAGICKSLGIFVYAIGGMNDHAHFLIQLPPVMPLAKAVATIKSNSSRWANEKGHKLTRQQGYAAFSVSASIVPADIPQMAAISPTSTSFSFRIVAIRSEDSITSRE